MNTQQGTNYGNIYRTPYSWGTPIPLVRPVSSIEEVKAHPIDFDGSIFYFPDIANKKIYTKSMNMDGTVSISLYELKPIADQAIDSSYITRQEFENTINELKEYLTSKEQEISQLAAQQSQQNKYQF